MLEGAPETSLPGQVPSRRRSARSAWSAPCPSIDDVSWRDFDEVIPAAAGAAMPRFVSRRCARRDNGRAMGGG